MEIKAAGGVHNPSNRLPAGENFFSSLLAACPFALAKDVEFLDFSNRGVRVTFAQVARSRNVLIMLLLYFQMTLSP